MHPTKMSVRRFLAILPLLLCVALLWCASPVVGSSVFVSDEGVRVDAPLYVQEVDVSDALLAAQAAAKLQAITIAKQAAAMETLQTRYQLLQKNLTDTNAVIAEQDQLLAQQAALLSEQAALISSLQSYDESNTAHLLVIEAAAAALALRVSAEESNITVLTSEVEVMQLAMRVLNGTIASHTQQIAQLTDITEAHEEAIDGLRQFDAEVTAELTALKANATILLARVAADEVAAAALQVRVAATEAEIVLIKNRLTSAEATEATLTQTQLNHTASINLIDAITANHTATISKIVSDILTLESEVRTLQHNDLVLNATLISEERAALELAIRVTSAENLRTDSSQLVSMVLYLLSRTNSLNESLIALQGAIATANSSLVAVLAAEQAAVTALTTRVNTVETATTQLTTDTFYNVTQLLTGIEYVTGLIKNFTTPKMYRHTFLTSTTWTVPAGVSGAFVTMAGGGGSGYGWRIYNAWQTGPSGGYVLSQPVTLIGGETITITVGTGGAGSRPITKRLITSGTYSLYLAGSDAGVSGYPGSASIITSPTNGELLRCDGGSGMAPTVYDYVMDSSPVAGNVNGYHVGSGAGTYVITQQPANGTWITTNGPGACGASSWGIGNAGQVSYATGSGSWPGGSTPIGYGSGGGLTRNNCYVTDTTQGQCTSPADGRDGAVFIDLMY